MKREFGRPLILRLLLTLFITTVIFIDIFFVANVFSQMNYQKVQEGNNIIFDYIESANKRLENFVCDRSLLEDSSRSLDDVGVKLGLLEDRFGKGDERVLNQKELYSQLEKSHFDLTKKFEESCNLEFISVLFFYTNDELYEEESEKMGFVISSFKKEDFSKIMVYSFDCNLRSDIVSGLRDKYGVTSCPNVVVNEGSPFYLRNIDELQTYLEE